MISQGLSDEDLLQAYDKARANHRVAREENRSDIEAYAEAEHHARVGVLYRMSMAEAKKSRNLVECCDLLSLMDSAVHSLLVQSSDPIVAETAKLFHANISMILERLSKSAEEVVA